MKWKDEVESFKKELKTEQSSTGSSCIKFGFFGLVGGGKSVTAGIFAISITPEGFIGWIDGESKRSGFAIDQLADMAVKEYGGDKQQWINRFKVVHIDPPFNPLKIVAAIELLEDEGVKTIIADVMSQAWDSEGGYLDLKNEETFRMAGDDVKKQERSAMAAAAHIKPWTHQKMVNKVNSSNCNIVLLFQAKQKYNAKKFKPDDFITPIQESGLTRTALAVGRVEAKMVGDLPQGGFCTFKGAIEQGTKYTHPKILELLPGNGQQLKFSHGKAIAEWCASAGAVPESTPEPKQNLVAMLKQKLWNLTKEYHKEDVGEFEKWMKKYSLIEKDESVTTLDADRLEEVIDMTEVKISELRGVE